MPTHVVLPRALPSAADCSRPLDFEGELRAAALRASPPGALDGDVLEALACLACEVLDGAKSSCEETLLTSLRAATTSLLEDAGVDKDVAERVLAAVVAAANADCSNDLAVDGVQNDVIGCTNRQAEERTTPSVLPATLPSKLPPLLVPLRRKRAAVPLNTALAPDVVADEAAGGSQKRWRTRGDKELERQKKYIQEHHKVQAVELERQALYEREVADFYARPTDGQSDEDEPIPIPKNDDVSSDEEDEEDEETRKDRAVTKQRLRRLGEVATFFGETDAERTTRLNRLELLKEQDVLATGSTNVMQLLDRRNARAGISTFERDEEDYAAFKPHLDAIRDKPAVSVAGGGTGSRAVKTPLADAIDDDAAVDFPWEEKGSRADIEAAAEAEETDEIVRKVVVWLRDSLHLWEASIIARGKDGNETVEFKQEKANFRQSKQYLRPLRRALRDQAISPDVVANIAVIADYCQQSKYKEAKEAYMRLAIGSQAWPIGITFVTIHDRSARHRIGEGKVAHILNDETTRKYIQMVKRLATFYELHRPTDPLNPSHTA